MTSIDKKISVFWETHPVFTIEDLRKFLNLQNPDRKVSDIILHNKRMGRIGTIKTGLYYVIRPGQTTDTTQVDPFLLTAKLSSDSILAFHTSLDLLGFGHSLFNTFYYYSTKCNPAYRYRNNHYRCILQPEILQKKMSISFGIEKVERSGIKLNITGKDRTLVDVLEKPQFSGGFEETFRSLEKIPYIQTDIILQYLDLREQKNLFARVGYFLEQHREQFMIEESFLEKLERNKPRQPLYWDRSRRGGILKTRWNLIVPEEVHLHTWEEI
jgi:predicted transcriptional regulator of viral defense system